MKPKKKKRLVKKTARRAASASPKTKKTARGASSGRPKAKAARKPLLGAVKLEQESDTVDMQSILTEVHGAANDHKRIEHWEQIECPYCGEVFEVHIDSAEDGQTMYQDCHVCCKPISLLIEVEEEDVHVSVARA